MNLAAQDGGAPQFDALLDDETIFPSQWLSLVVSNVPEKRLLFAVLIEAWRTLYTRGTAAETAQVWFMIEGEDESPFTFVNVCETLGLVPHLVRARVMRTLAPSIHREQRLVDLHPTMLPPCGHDRCVKQRCRGGLH